MEKITYNTAISFLSFSALDAIEKQEPFEKKEIVSNGAFAIIYSGITEAKVTNNELVDITTALLAAEFVRSQTVNEKYSMYSIISKFIALSITKSIIQ